MSKYVLKVWVNKKYRVRIYGKKTGGPGVTLTYGVNDSGTPDFTDTPLSTSGQLVKTIYVNPNDTVYIRNDGDYSQCSQEATDSYCSSYTCTIPESFVITANTDISTQVDTSLSC